ncbi:hypothetical protein D3C73_1399550 [compost metagenome]
MIVVTCGRCANPVYILTAIRFVLSALGSFVCTTTASLAAMGPYIAIAATSFNTSIDLTISILILAKRLVAGPMRSRS